MSTFSLPDFQRAVLLRYAFSRWALLEGSLEKISHIFIEKAKQGKADSKPNDFAKASCKTNRKTDFRRESNHGRSNIMAELKGA